MLQGDFVKTKCRGGQEGNKGEVAVFRNEAEG